MALAGPRMRRLAADGDLTAADAAFSQVINLVHRGDLVELLESRGGRARVSLNGEADAAWVCGWLDESLLEEAPACGDAEEGPAVDSAAAREAAAARPAGGGPSVRVFALSGEELGRFSVTPGDTVRDLKRQLQDRMGIPLQQQRLLSESCILSDKDLVPPVETLQFIKNRSQRARVALRCRPMSNREVEHGEATAVFPSPTEAKCHFASPDNILDRRDVHFDAVLDRWATQQQLFEALHVPELVEQALDGVGAAVLAYGPTGCGKTFSMVGEMNSVEFQGLLPRAAELLFRRIAERPQAGYRVHASFLALVNGQLSDLLRERRPPAGRAPALKLQEQREGGLFLPGLSQLPVESLEQVLALLQRGLNDFLVECTQMEWSTSWSDLLFSLTVTRPTGGGHFSKATLLFADLMGSERGNPQLPRSMSNANLKRVVQNLGEGKFAPYRDSPLTRLLKDSLGGRSHLAVVVACTPAAGVLEETKRSARFGELLRLVENWPEASECPGAWLDRLGIARE